MEIEVSIHEAQEPVAVMRIKGKIDASNFVEIINQSQEIYKKPVHNLIIDLSEVPFISSAGLVAIHKISLIYSGGQQEVQQEAKRPAQISLTTPMRANGSSSSVRSLAWIKYWKWQA